MALTTEENERLEQFLEFLLNARNAWRIDPEGRAQCCTELIRFAELILMYTVTRRAANHIPPGIRPTWYETLDSFAVSVMGYATAQLAGYNDYSAPMWEMIAKMELYIRCGLKSPILKRATRGEVAAIHRN